MIETNIFRFSLKKQKDHKKFCDILREEHGILASPSFANDAIRLVTHRDVSRDDMSKVIVAIGAALEKKRS